MLVITGTELSQEKLKEKNELTEPPNLLTYLRSQKKKIKGFFSYYCSINKEIHNEVESKVCVIFQDLPYHLVK